ncbi:MAG: hypothetical protein E2O79_10860, partial [Caldithrix sp.]
MKQHKRNLVAGGICFAILIASISMIEAGGFIRIRPSGDVYRWDDSVPVPFNPDQGMLGVLSNTDAVNMVNGSFGLWGNTNIPTSNLSFINAGQLSMDVVTAADFAAVTGTSNGLSPIIFDADGSIFEALGIDALGFASINVVTATEPYLVLEGFAVLNGDYIDGDTSDGNETTLESFGGVMAHEFGHFLNLAHSQVNGHYFLGDRDDPGFITYGSPPAASLSIMFPIALGLPGEPTGPTTDDIRTISTLYPAGGFPGAFGKIEGQVFENDAISSFQGANVIARNQNDPFFDASTWVTGLLKDSVNPSTFGAYELNGLTNDASYTIEVVNINSRFEGPSRVPPRDPPVPLPGPEEFFNGANESSDAGSDQPLDFTVVTATGTVSGIDIIFNDESKLVQLDKSDNNAEFILSVQSLITRFNTPNGPNDYAAVRYSIPASVHTPFTVSSFKFFNNDNLTVWPRVLLTTANASDQPDLDNPLAEVNDVTGPERSLITVPTGVTRTSLEDIFVVVQFPPGEAVAASGSGGGPAIGADAGRIGRGGFEFGYVPGNLFSSDGITFQETNTAPDIGSPDRSVDAANWEMSVQLTGDNLGPDNLEPNDDLANATPISYGETMKAVIAPAGELDYYEFTGSAGDTIQVDIAAQTHGSMLDGFLTLLDGNGTPITVHDDEFSGFGEDPKLQTVLPTDGNYFLVMDVWENVANGQPLGGPSYFYELHLDTFSPAFEPNNEISQATPLKVDEKLIAAIDLKGDIDFYSFNAQAGDFLATQVFLADVGLLDPVVISFLSPVVTLFDTDGTTVLETENASILQTTLPSDGTYFLAIADLDSSGGAGFFYAVSIEVGLELPSPVNLTARDGLKDKVELSWTPPQVNEIEPNIQPQNLSGPAPILVAGSAEIGDPGGIMITFSNGIVDIVEDLFDVRTESPGLNLRLTGTSSDLDLWLFALQSGSLITLGGPSAEDRGTISDQTINVSTLPPGSYIIGVSIFDSNPVGPSTSPYRLIINGDIPGTGPSLQSFNIYRSETSNAVSSGSAIANVGFRTTSFTDQNLAANTFFYQIT